MKSIAAKTGLPIESNGLAAELTALARTPCVSTQLWACAMLRKLGPNAAAARELRRLPRSGHADVREALRRTIEVLTDGTASRKADFSVGR